MVLDAVASVLNVTTLGILENHGMECYNRKSKKFSQVPTSLFLLWWEIKFTSAAKVEKNPSCFWYLLFCVFN